jgi:hypothetical protein
MSTTYERLVEAGAPDLAEPYFYRIRETGTGEHIEIQLRRKNPKFGSLELGKRGYVHIASTAPDQVLPQLVGHAKRLVREYEQSTQSRIQARSLIGDAARKERHHG